MSLTVSKKSVNKAGEVLRNEPRNEAALEVLDVWRTMHAEPLQKTAGTVLELCPPDTFNGIASRLKRSISIIEKLKREPAMKLFRMLDIAGVRLVINDGTEFNTKQLSVFNVIREYDYNNEPKVSGYSAYHIVLECKEEKFRNFQIELQIRTCGQHLWAMAVETVGMFYGEALKASQGNQDWLDFFRLASAAVSRINNRKVIKDYSDKGTEEIRNELKTLGMKKTFFSKLEAIKEAREKFSYDKYDYWLLELDIKKSENRIYGFVSGQLETAAAMYKAIEQTPNCLRGDTQVVLVSTKRFKDLRRAYPSYFLDVAEFTQMLKEFCE
ncbi:MAG: hypothetical protein FWE67_04575 [Planctomycetaceae bacterium]|nr:hypothetical protein [Planctomycetaceae bacterium]